MKYVEDLNVPVARHRPRYDEVADAMAVVDPNARRELRRAPLEQLWRDHLLVGSLAADSASAFDRRTFALVYPSGTTVVSGAVTAYQGYLTNHTTFLPWTLEELLNAIHAAGTGPWVTEVATRYLVTAEDGSEAHSSADSVVVVHG